MKKNLFGKLLGAAGITALVASIVPFRFKSDKETGEFEVGGLLWNLKKTPGAEEDTFTMELLPFVDKETEEDTAAAAEAAAEEAAAPAEEEPFTEAAPEAVVVEADTDSEPFTEETVTVTVEEVNE